MNIDPSQLPHWVRVLFAARCARRVVPLFEAAWPNAIERRRKSLTQAIALAEASSAQAKPCDGLNDACIEATITAGRAQIPHLSPRYNGGDEDEEQDDGPDAPKDTYETAALAALVSARLARAALVSPDESARYVADAWSFTLDALAAAGKQSLIFDLEHDYEQLQRIAKSRLLTDASGVSAEALASKGPRGRSWWRFW